MSDTTETVAADKSRVRSLFDPASKSLTITGLSGGDFAGDMGALPEVSLLAMAARGVVLRLRDATDVAKCWAELLAGQVRVQKETKPAEPSIYEQAIALAWRDTLMAERGVKKADKPAVDALMAEAAALVATMDRTRKALLRQNADVIAHVAALKRKGNGEKTLRELMG